MPYCFQGDLSNFKITRLKKSSVLTKIEGFRTVTHVWIDRWLWNDRQSLTWYRSGALLFFKASNYKDTRDKKIADFDPNWAFPDRNSSLNSPMALKRYTKPDNILEEVPYCFSRSSIKFEGHTGQKITDFDPNWAFPDCNPGLNSPVDLKWCTKLDVVLRKEMPYFFFRSSIKFQGHTTWAEKFLIQFD